ncbi:MAG: phosphate ABC transporter, permease protein PstA [Deltaproteobacteria bacterium RBG_13_43_22]|nr:MAG: phosphate ABC transporter, permease protein PstA [Deltaproteobacteria bacterium RBG_13_43_22]
MRLNPILSQKIIKTLLWILTGSTIGILFFIIIYIFIKGLPQLSWTFLSTNPVDMGRSGGILATIVSTVYLIGIALFFATPLGLGTAIYLTEYTREGLITKIIRFGTESLAGIPSIILGLFGFAIFVIAFGWGWSLLSGGLTLSAMLLPTIIRTSEESILSVPQEYREVAFSLGVGKWKTITRVVLPAALPGIVTGIVLSIARSVGETAVIIFTAGSSLRFPSSIFESGRTLAVHFYILAREGISMPMAYGTAAILVLLILIINISAYMTMRFLMKRYS